MNVSRQHASTEVTELVGVVCEQLLAIPGSAPDVFVAAYLRASGIWYRFFLDAGLLFLDESAGPDPEDDLEPDANYVDLGAKLACQGDTIREMRMHDSTLSLRFSSGVSLLLRDFEEGSRAEVNRE